MKALVGNDDCIFGFTMIGVEAGEVVTVVQTAMLTKLPYAASRCRDRVPDHARRARRAALERVSAIGRLTASHLVLSHLR